MMRNSDDNLERMWDSLLSRDPEQVLVCFRSLSLGEQISVITHLERMITESGWLPVQRHSAQFALETIRQADI